VALRSGPSCDAWVISYMVEFITKGGKITDGIADLVLCMMKPGYGRQCQATKALEPVKYIPMPELLRTIHQRMAKGKFTAIQALANPRGHKRTALSGVKAPNKRIKLSHPANSGVPTWESPPRNGSVGAIVRKRKAPVTEMVLYDRQTKRDKTE
jgi:hypothetical protein